MIKKNLVAALLIFTLLLGTSTSLAIQADAAGTSSFEFKEDAPSAWAREEIITKISNGAVPEKLQRGFKRPITVGEYAELKYSCNKYVLSEWLLELIHIDDDSINDNSPDYVKKAFILGLIDSADELDKTMTREEAALRLVGPTDCIDGEFTNIDTTDYESISPDAIEAVGAYIQRLPSGDNKFYPKKLLTVEEAIAGMSTSDTDGILGFLYGADGLSSVTVKKNFISYVFCNATEYERYISDNVCPRIDTIEITGGRQRFDVGYGIIEIDEASLTVNYTLKNGVTNIREHDGANEAYTFGLDNYKSEPRELKSNETPNLEIQPDSIHKKLYTEIDKILKKILKQNMTQQQKIKVIHDYVVQNITYSGRDTVLSGASALQALNTKKGVCANYASLFYYMCKRANIPVRSLLNRSTASWHTWNLVYLNNKWLHVDTTWDDQKNKLIYDYYLKQTEFMMKSRIWRGFGYPDYNKYPKIDGMKIKSTMEFRIFLMQNVNSGTYNIKFRLMNKNIDKDYTFLCFYSFLRYTMKYDSKKDIYIMIGYDPD